MKEPRLVLESPDNSADLISIFEICLVSIGGNFQCKFPNVFYRVIKISNTIKIESLLKTLRTYFSYQDFRETVPCTLFLIYLKLSLDFKFFPEQVGAY